MPMAGTRERGAAPQAAPDLSAVLPELAALRTERDNLRGERDALHPTLGDTLAEVVQLRVQLRVALKQLEAVEHERATTRQTITDL